MDEIVVTVKAARLTENGQMYEAWLSQELLCTKHEPFLAAARVLQARGVPDETPLVMKHAGDDMVCLRSTVGKAAGLAITEGHKPPRFTKFKPYGREMDADSA